MNENQAKIKLIATIEPFGIKMFVVLPSNALVGKFHINIR
jgi:hypothetical protein